MTGIRLDRRIQLFSPIGLRLLDWLTGGPPIGRVSASLDRIDASGAWQATDTRVTETSSGVWSYPGLGRVRDPAFAPIVDHRVRVECEYYVPEFRSVRDGYEFTAEPWSDNVPPATPSTVPVALGLYPAANYPFPGTVAVLRGVVVDGTGAPMRDAEVVRAGVDRTITGANGEFALPVTLPATPTGSNVDASTRDGLLGSEPVLLPTELNQLLTITVI